MKKFTTLLVLPLLLASPALFAQQTSEVTSDGIGYLQYLPDGYQGNSKKFPVVISLHGIAERGTASTDRATIMRDLPRVANVGLPKYVKQGKKYPFILISPQLKNSYGSWPPAYIIKVLNHVKKTLRVDNSRIYLTGLSLGGFGTWSTAGAYPEVFAAIAPMCAGANALNKAGAIARENVAVWAFHGTGDRVVSHTVTTRMVDAVNSHRPATLAKVTLFPNMGHNIWDKAYNETDVLNWMLKFRNGTSGGNSAEPDDEDEPTENKGPTVAAGNDKTITLPADAVELVGEAKDSDGKIASLQWTQVAGTPLTLNNPNGSRLRVTDLQAGSYTFRLTAKDDKGATAHDDVILTIREGSSQKPEVDAGPDITITLPENSVVLKGSASAKDGKIESYQWTKVSGPSAQLQGTSSPELSITGLKEGTYIFRLTVKDDSDAKASDDVRVVVNEGTNKVPAVNAGTDRTLKLPVNHVQLNGTARDEDGKIVHHQWSKVSGNQASLQGTESPNLTVTDMTAGTYVFRLTVRDDKGASASDDVAVRVEEADAKAPVANAGADQTVQLPRDHVQLRGSGEDDGSIVGYHWTQVSGPAAQLSGSQSSVLAVSGLQEGTYIFRLTVTDDDNIKASDDVTVRVVRGNNIAPVAYAGPDRTIRLPENSLRIEGSGQDEDGSIESYEWTQAAGRPATLRNTTYPALLVSDLSEGTYTFVLTVRDNNGATSSDPVRVTVQGPIPTSEAPDDRQFPIEPISISPENQRRAQTNPDLLRNPELLPGPVRDAKGKSGRLIPVKHKQ